MTEPTRIVLAKGYSLPDDPDAVAYIAAVEAADGQALEATTRMAINGFVKGCKADGIWPAIKASCILAGARTLAGALVPLVGTAPTNVGGLFVTGDYNRKTGLVGNGSTKYLDSNRNNNADPQNNFHQAVYATVASSTIGYYMGAGHLSTGSTEFFSFTGNTIGSRNRNPTFDQLGTNAAGLIGQTRALSSQYLIRSNATSTTQAKTSESAFSGNVHVFASNNVIGSRGLHRLAFYSIGESLDLAKLDTRVTALINAINVAF